MPSYDFRILRASWELPNPEVLIEFHFHLQPLQAGSFYEDSGELEGWPTKLFEDISAEIPLIASDFPLWRYIVYEERCGLVVDPLSVEAKSHAIEYILTHPREAEEVGRTV